MRVNVLVRLSIMISKKINYRVRAEIVVRARKHYRNKEEARLTQRRSVGLASNLNGGIFAQRKK